MSMFTYAKLFFFLFFFSATLTSKGVISGFLFLLVHFQTMQTQIRQEINDVIGKERQPCQSDREKMPYTYACMLEALRYQSHLSISATHTASEDVIFEDYLIPKGASVRFNLSSRVQHMHQVCRMRSVGSQISLLFM